MALPHLAIHVIKPFGDCTALRAMHPSYSTLSCCLRTVTQPEHWLSKALQYLAILQGALFGTVGILELCLTLRGTLHWVWVRPMHSFFSSICMRDETHNAETVLNRRLPPPFQRLCPRWRP